MQQTLSIIKPDAVEKNQIGNILARLEAANFKIKAMRLALLTQKEAENFYAIHKEKPFFKDLVKFMTSGPCVLLKLESENAVENLRKLMGSTDPKKADKGTIRADFATNIERNAIHGSDSLDNAKKELDFFFK